MNPKYLPGAAFATASGILLKAFRPDVSEITPYILGACVCAGVIGALIAIEKSFALALLKIEKIKLEAVSSK